MNLVFLVTATDIVWGVCMSRKPYTKTTESIYGLKFTVVENDGDGDFVLSMTVRDERDRELFSAYLTDDQAQALALNLNVARKLYHNRQDAKIPRCSECKGRGAVEMYDFYGPSYYVQCSDCKGTGRA